ncbi:MULTISPECIES: hypothetical protein [Dyadobacter]|uniref:Uncharacterized protein n=1 Tax=Dyadobacter chenhuakuii TaxID=2909339 RepID=A0A9X1Q930_9BACT|nr:MULTISPECIES: hypothetical protein [Dyadobacter]MCE7070430.1 hypothetical protein [Dyadobacter sp. CY327]MCF2496866.1 hypothetical protein [Dyadobacter chenhuakuii]MCF2520792.1 hypothetical protein [Dyadobacter sp. CY351]
MSKIFFLKIIYRSAVSLHKITSIVESFNGARIKHLNFISKGRVFVGVIAFEASQLIDFERILNLIKRNRDISEVEQITEASLC